MSSEARLQQPDQPLIEGIVVHLPEINERIMRCYENYEFRAHLCGWSQCGFSDGRRTTFTAIARGGARFVAPFESNTVARR